MTYLTQRILQKPHLQVPLLSLALISLALIALQAIPASAQTPWSTPDPNIHNTNTGNVGIGTGAITPVFPLQVRTVVPSESKTLAQSGTFAITNHTDLHGLYFGVGPSGKVWLQVARHDGPTDTYDLILQSAGGKVGIGTTNPSAKLEVFGNINVTGTGMGNITATGTIEANIIKSKYQDVAEWVPASEQIPAGTVVVLDATKSNHVIPSTKGYDTRVAGVISEQPGITLGERGENKVLVATTGRVRIKVDATRGPIHIGDLLVTSDVPGLAMKSVPVNVGGVRLHRPGTLIGKALEPLERGSGKILVLLSLQ